jgi:hypothetical protein
MWALRKSQPTGTLCFASEHKDQTVPLHVSKTLHNGERTYQPCLKVAPVVEKEAEERRSAIPVYGSAVMPA